MYGSMQTFFHIDKKRGLNSGQVIVADASGLTPFGRLHSGRIQQAGMSYDPPFTSLIRDEMTRREYYLEAARRMLVGEDETIYSRFSAFFCCENLESVSRMAKRMKIRPGCPIFEVETESAVSRHDMTWLDFVFPPTFAPRLHYYRAYWRGSSIDDPNVRPPGLASDHSSLFEVLIPGEVRIGRQVGRT